MRQWIVGVGLSIGMLAAHGEATLSIGDPRVVAGAPFELLLTITNDDDSALSVELPSQVHVQLATPGAVSTLEFEPEQTGELLIAAGEFRKIRLRGSLPTEARGAVTLATSGLEANVLMIQVEAPPPVAVAAVPNEPAEAQVRSMLIDRPPELGLDVYEPVYFIVGGDDGLNAKFQLSFRYQLFDSNGPLGQRLPWIDDLHLSFSQTSLWDLNDLSKPFTDSSYRPRLFYADYDLHRMLDGQLRLGVETGFGHESNGKEGEDSRSFNMVYVRPTLTYGDPEGLRFYFAPLIHNYLGEDENPDIEDYRGYVDWLFGFGSKGGLDFWATLRKGERGDYGSIEANLSYPLSKLSGGDLRGWLMLQYFGGYGESLVSYREKLDSQWRLGLSIAL